MNKILTIAVLAAAMAGPASAGGTALEALGGIAGPGAAAAVPAPDACREPGPGATIEEIIAWIRCVELPRPPAAPDGAEKRTLVHPKIRISPVTAAWKDTMLVKFRKVSFETVRAAMAAAGARTWTFGENDGAYIVRLDIADAKAPHMAMALAAQPAVEAVEVNRAVYDALREGSSKASQAMQSMSVYRKGQAILADVPASNGRQLIAAFRADGPQENLPYVDLNVQLRYRKNGSMTFAETKVRAMWTRNGFMAPPLNVAWHVPGGEKVVGVRLLYKLGAHHELEALFHPELDERRVLVSSEPAIVGIAPDLIGKLKAYIAE